MPDDPNDTLPSLPTQPPRAAFRRYYSLPPWFAAACAQEPRPADLEERLTEWFRQQHLEQEKRERERGGQES